jgi:hypothetical protein
MQKCALTFRICNNDQKPLKYAFVYAHMLFQKIRAPVMTYACPVWEFAADTYLLKLQCLQNKVLCTIGNFPGCTPVLNLNRIFNLPYVHDYVTKWCRRQA